MIKNLTILGAGSWGATIAWHLSKKGYSVKLWDKKEEILRIKETGRCQKIKDLLMPKDIRLEPELPDALRGSELVVFAVPSQAVRGVSKEVSQCVKTGYFVSLVKGIENHTLKRMSEVICEEIKDADVAVISGPSHAEEVCRQLPTAAVVAGNEDAFVQTVQEIFHSAYFRLYTNSDIIGVELAGALKNVIAIACGVSDGLGFGDNTKAALMTRGLAEIGRLGRAMAADPHTFAGLAGVGDLIATCTSSHSRNRNLGEALAKGKPLETALKELNMVAEGVPTTISAAELGKKFSVELPITDEVYAILFKNKGPGRAVKDLLSREAGTEWR